MIREENTDRVRALASELGIGHTPQDTLTFIFARNSYTVICKIERQRPDGRYQSMEVTRDLQTEGYQIEQVTSDRAASEMSRAVTAVVDKAFNLPPQPTAKKGIFLLEEEGPSTVLRYDWDDTNSKFKQTDTEELDKGTALFFLEMAQKMIAATNSFEA